LFAAYFKVKDFWEDYKSCFNEPQRQIFGGRPVKRDRLQFWVVEKGETFLYRYAFGPGAWLGLLPDGRFDASPEGIRYLCYTEQGTLNSRRTDEGVL